MVDVLGIHRLDEAQIVGDTTDMGEPFTNSCSALPAALELCTRPHHDLLLIGRHGRQPLAVSNGVRQQCSLQLCETRLPVEQLNLRRPARLRQVNHPLCARRKMSRLQNASTVDFALHRRQRNCAEANACSATEKVAPS